MNQGKFAAAIVVVSAADGPIPQTREQLERARTAGIDRLIVVLTNAGSVNDTELLQLVELEMRELLDSIGFKRMTTALIRDNENTWVARLLREMDAAVSRR